MWIVALVAVCLPLGLFCWIVSKLTEPFLDVQFEDRKTEARTIWRGAVHPVGFKRRTR